MEETLDNVNTGQTLKESFTSVFSKDRDIQKNNVRLPKSASTEK